MGQMTYADKEKIFELMNYAPHAGQRPIHESNARVRTVCCGRRFGKSYLASAEAVVCAIVGGGSWVVAPDYELSTIVFDQALQFVTQGPLMATLAAEPRVSRGRQLMVFKSGGWILGKSSHKPRSLLGRGLDLVINDEAATEANAEIYFQYLRPVLLERVGHFLPISTPRGENWFKDLYDRGQDPTNKNYQSWQMPSVTNPDVGAEFVEEMRQDMPEDLFRQEVLAAFLQERGALFRGYAGVSIIDEMGEVMDDSLGFAIGVDLGRHQDYTVISVIEIATGREVWLERFNQLDWTIMEDRIRIVAEMFPGAPMLVDSTGIGDRVFSALEQIINDRLLEQFIFNNIRKVNLINQLALAIQNMEVFYLSKEAKDREGFTLGQYAMGEMSSYRYEKTPGGRLTMNAPKGKHDDVVIARALALHCAMAHGGTFKVQTHNASTQPNSSGTESLKKEFGQGTGMAPEHGRNFGSSKSSLRRFGKR
jgi:hypothetical protein